jgi:two-component system response regulator HydG
MVDMEGTKKNVLVVDDNQASQFAISRALERSGYQIFPASDGKTALNYLQEKEIHVVVTDLKLPDISGDTILVEAKKIDPAIIVILITGYGTIESAVEAMRKGAYHYLKKPISINELRMHVERALETQELQYKVADLSRKLDEKYGFGGLIGVSEEMRNVFKQIRQVAPTRSTVLIHGESGTGKELIARAIHHNSSRKEKPFLAINCSTLSSNILESELFGHEKGAFTGASEAHQGYFEVVNKGTIFLDEIGDMTLATQAKILRVLEEREFIRVGGTSPIKTDIRIIAATNVNLEQAVAEKRFREDLYYRLKVFSIHVPQLKYRKDDLPLFVNYFLKQYKKENEKAPLRVSKEVMHCLVAYHWPGNVRELKNFLERASITCSNGMIGLRDLPAGIRESVPDISPGKTSKQGIQIYVGDSMEHIEKKVIEETLTCTGGNRTLAAKILKIGLRTLQRKLKRFNLG